MIMLESSPAHTPSIYTSRDGDVEMLDTGPLPYNDNLVTNPAAPWNAHRNPTTLQSLGPPAEDRPKNLPIYDRETYHFVDRTLRAYRLVVRYKQDCPTGRRWLPPYIKIIREAGKNLESDRATLRKLCAAQQIGVDTVPLSKIRSLAEVVRNDCAKLQELIRLYEEVPVIYGRAVEAGNFVRSAGHSSRKSSLQYGRDEDLRQEGSHRDGRRETHPHIRAEALLLQPDRGNLMRRNALSWGTYDSWRPSDA